MSQPSSLRLKLYLAGFGCLFGAALLCIVYLAFPQVFTELAVPKGAQFDSIDDLRASMTKHDDRDVSADGSVSLRSIVTPNESDQIIYELKPNLSVKFQHAPVTTNSFGMRNRETTLEKPADTYRIALMGDSYTFGWGVEQSSTFAHVMEDKVNSLLGGKKKVEILNFGVPGYATFQEVALFFEKALKFQPDAVMFYVIPNDFGLPFFIRDLQTNTSLVSATEFHTKKLSPEDTEALKRREEMFKSLDGNRAMLKLFEYTDAHKMPVWVVFHPSAQSEQFMDKFWALKNPENQRSFTKINIYDEFKAALARKEEPEESLHIPHDNHPGPGAHRIIGRLLGEELAKILAQ